MAFRAGTKLGPYEVLAPIGSGGMGEVYKARDAKLARDVAIKVLPAAMSHDPERLTRFEREAKVLASLNHPNMAQIYAVVEGASYGVRSREDSGRSASEFTAFSECPRSLHQFRASGCMGADPYIRCGKLGIRGGSMKRVLLVGLDPATVDFSDPALPPGMTVEKIHSGVKLALADFVGRGWHAEICSSTPTRPRSRRLSGAWPVMPKEATLTCLPALSEVV